MSRRFWKRFFSDPLSAASMFYLVLLALLALLADFIAPYEPMAQELIARYGTPSTDHWFGTDGFGRDLFSRVIYGARFAFQALAVSMSIAVLGGVPVGLVAGYFGGRIDRVITWFIDVIFTVPAIMMRQNSMLMGRGWVAYPALALCSVTSCPMLRHPSLYKSQSYRVQS